MLSQHLLILPVLLPAALAALSLLLGRRMVLKRGLALLGGGVMLLLSLSLLLWADHGAIQVYRLGGWQPPFGIMLQLDRLSAWMLVLTALLALEVQAYAAISNWDRRGSFFHELFWLQWMGLNGAFLTGDLFNLFVFFELLLIASYGLLVHGDGKARIALVGASLGEARAVMVEGGSGLIAIAPHGRRPRFEPSKRRLLWPSGAQATLYSAGEPESLRGPQHSHACRPGAEGRLRQRDRRPN